jgi:hypothetical protein
MTSSLFIILLSMFAIAYIRLLLKLNKQSTSDCEKGENKGKEKKLL